MKKAITILRDAIFFGILATLTVAVIAGLVIAIHSHTTGMHF